MLLMKPELPAITSLGRPIRRRLRLLKEINDIYDHRIGDEFSSPRGRFEVATQS
jgi:hypothetical protein